MLNSPLTRSSQTSPSWHYAEPSPRIPQLLRRTSKSTAHSPMPQLKTYVDVGTQWSPRTDSLPLDQSLKKEKKLAESPQQAQATVPAMPSVPGTDELVHKAKASLIPGTPSMKRRQSGGTSEPASSLTRKSQNTSPKRPKGIAQPLKVLPAQYEFCEVEDMVILIANMISELIQTNDALPLRTGVLTRFHSRTPPGISVMDYLQRLAKHATLTPPLLLSMVYYIDRLCSLYPAFTITTLTVHRFLITAATVAAKGLSDSFWNNATYARVGGVKVAELGLLELDFLYRVDWKIVPNPEVLVDYYQGLVERSEGYELENDGTTDEEDDDIDTERSSADSPEAKQGAVTDTKWNAWMQDVSTKRMADAEEDVHKESCITDNAG
ncbi:hypothetical protein BP6252_02216 [Coleophoma cylindrospora]|uniref:Nuc-1 negative regulatory protein preg n=1 Tax=Coleophoma cylindrospora TaxID=1849047 RepID=A0A3D8SE61_9HELO|nr:hypothetical protein BP6252_02216 [Coleophoma cylindrospora]